MISNQLSFLRFGAARYTGPADRYVRFAMEHQLLNAATWKSFVRVFTSDSDDANHGWRCEYWGKMMRGACLTYMYNRDGELYAVLEETVRDMLRVQRPDGRFSTYSGENQLHGWDIWGRKYILTSMLHFYRICRDEALKEEILAALCRHTDALIDRVGAGEGKVDITLASDHWLGVNSCSILDAVLDLFRETGEQRYLEFGEYIISTGGIQGGNLINLALENRLMPYEYPETKAYETMSFFEGLLTYYEVTGNPRYLQAVTSFVEAVNDTDITIIGCAGCTHELFDHSKVKQTAYSDIIMQETCVTVTWMRLMARLHLLTGEKKYFDRMEQSAYNALYGSANENRLPQYSLFELTDFDPLPFDSYSPLYNNVRGRGVGGWQRFDFGGGYGCCACIASAGIAIFPLCALLKSEDGFVLNGLLSGTVTETAPDGQPVTLQIESKWPVTPRVQIRLQLERPGRFTLKLRVPDCCEHPVLSVNGEEIPCEAGYARLERCWQDGDTVLLTGAHTLKTTVIEGRTAFTYGPLVLAADAAKGTTDLTEEILLKRENGRPVYELQPPCKDCHELVRLTVQRADGGQPLLLTDYASCGKRWKLPDSRMSVWMNIRG